MSEWKDVTMPGSDLEHHVLVVERGRDGKPTVRVSAKQRTDSYLGTTIEWETALLTPRTGPPRWRNDDSDIVWVPGDRRSECEGKTADQLRELFREWSES